MRAVVMVVEEKGAMAVEVMVAGVRAEATAEAGMVAAKVEEEKAVALVVAVRAVVMVVEEKEVATEVAVMVAAKVEEVKAVEEKEGGWVEVATEVEAMAAVSAAAMAVAAKEHCTIAQTRRALQRM